MEDPIKSSVLNYLSDSVVEEYYSVWDILEALDIPKEQIGEVKIVLEDAIDKGVLERVRVLDKADKIKKFWYRWKIDSI